MNTNTDTLNTIIDTIIKYDLVGKIATKTKLTRKTIVDILKGIGQEKLNMFKNNPEEFIDKCIKLINEQKSTMIVEYITYNKLEEKFESNIFTADKNQDFSKAFESKKAIQNYIFTDGYADESIERKFVKALEGATEVVVYAKLPKGFHIPTHVGNYSPDWAIVFDKDRVKHIFFIAGTKGSMSSLDLRPIEETKISCAKKLFESISSENIKYHKVDSFKTLIDIFMLK